MEITVCCNQLVLFGGDICLLMLDLSLELTNLKVQNLDLSFWLLFA
jgi:hypothetical protein